MYYKLKDSRTPTTTSNIEENVNTLYNGCNTAGKQLEYYQPSSDQLEDQVLDITLKSSPELEMQEEYTNVSNQGPNWNPAREPPAYNQYNSSAQMAYKPTRSTPLGNLN